MHSSRLRTAWRLWVVLGTCAALAYPVVPSAEAASVLGAVVGGTSCLLVVTGVIRHRPADVWAWLLFLGGEMLWVAGDVADTINNGRPVFPSVADAFYLAAYAVFALGLLRMSRDRWARWSGGLIDSAIVAVSLGIVYWVFVVGKVATNMLLPPPTRIATAAYPIAGVVLCAVLLPTVLRRGKRTASARMLIIGCAYTLACNVLYSLVPVATSNSGTLLSTGYLMAYVCWAAAALHPSTHDRPLEPEPEQFGLRRVVLLATAMLLVPAVLLIRRAASVDHLSWLVIGAGSGLLIVLVTVRLGGFVRTVQRQADRLRDLAMRDDLTGLPNRRSFERHVTEAMAAGSAQIAVVDLADFRNVNDRLGRAAADRALIAVADRLSVTAPAPMVVARMGGDEFALLIPDVTIAEADAIAQRVAESLRRPIDADGQELLLDVRIGVAGAGNQDTDAGELLRRADTALDAAKRHGSRYRRYTDELDEHAEQDVALGADLRHALDRDEFRLVYQPIVTLPTGETVAVETLVRWEHPARGFVSPAEFVPVAERTGLIVELGAWIMRTACQQAAIWRAELGPDGPRYVSVNVSAHQLAQPDFAEFVADVLRETGLRGGDLLVEVTETAIFSGGPAVRTLERLEALGVRIALDDFGTGHSSLGLLQNVPVDVLKVDKSFVDNVTASGRQAVIAEALIKVAEGLGLDAVAEGVETAEQAAELARLGYRLAQGYHFGKPVPQPAFRRAGVAIGG